MRPHRGPSPKQGTHLTGRKAHTYLKTFLLSCLHDSNLSTAVRFSEILSFSRLILFNEFIKFVAAIDESAIVAFICSFSDSKLNILPRFLFLSLSFFFLSFEDPKKEDEGVWEKDWTVPEVWP